MNDKPEFIFSDEFNLFLESLPKKDAAKMIRLIVDTEEKGLVEAFGRQWVKKLDDNLYELRSKVGSNIQRRMYFQIINQKYYITHGFTKKLIKLHSSKFGMQRISVKHILKEGIRMAKNAKEYLNEHLKDPEFKREYEIATEESLAADAVYLMRTQLGMTQTELANAANKSQSAIARIENGSVVPNITTLTEIASAVGKKVKLEIV